MIMIKKIYTAPEAEIALFEPEGVIAFSGGTEEVTNGGSSDGWSDWEE